MHRSNITCHFQDIKVSYSQTKIAITTELTGATCMMLLILSAVACILAGFCWLPFKCWNAFCFRVGVGEGTAVMHPDEPNNVAGILRHFG